MAPFDIAPTAALPGLHLRGMVMRRFLITYPVPPQALTLLLPPGAELSLRAGCAWVSACFVRIKRMRPSPLPETLGGIGFNYLIHRTRAKLPYPDGKLRESVLVLEANINRPVFAFLGRQTPGVRFRARDIALTTTRESFTITMRDDNGALLYDAVLPRASFTDRLPAGSCFPSLDQADHFLLGVPFGGEWHPDAGRLRLFAETHDPWEARAGTCRTRCNAFLEGLGVSPEADHVITMTRVPHYFPLFGFDVPIAAAGAAAPALR